MEILKDWGHSPLLDGMLHFAAFEKRPFNAHDAQAMAEACNVIRTAMVQPVGANAAAKKRDKNAVTDIEVNRAVAIVLATAMTLWLSGGLDGSRWPDGEV